MMSGVGYCILSTVGLESRYLEVLMFSRTVCYPPVSITRIPREDLDDAAVILQVSV